MLMKGPKSPSQKPNNGSMDWFATATVRFPNLFFTHQTNWSPIGSICLLLPVLIMEQISSLLQFCTLLSGAGSKTRNFTNAR